MKQTLGLLGILYWSHSIVLPVDAWLYVHKYALPLLGKKVSTVYNEAI